MSQYLVVDPDKLYKIYSPDTIKEYYPFDFLPEFTSIERETFYDILNSLSMKELVNMNRYIFKQWSLTKGNDELMNSSPLKRKKDVLSRPYSHESILSKDELNSKLNEFIQGDKVISLYCMNQMLKFLYPC